MVVESDRKETLVFAAVASFSFRSIFSMKLFVQSATIEQPPTNSELILSLDLKFP